MKIGFVSGRNVTTMMVREWTNLPRLVQLLSGLTWVVGGFWG